MQHRLHLIDTASLRDDECEIHAPAPAECATEIGADDPSSGRSMWYVVAIVAIVALAALVALWVASDCVGEITTRWI